MVITSDTQRANIKAADIELCSREPSGYQTSLVGSVTATQNSCRE
jgi:hypothetical protein